MIDIVRTWTQYEARLEFVLVVHLGAGVNVPAWSRSVFDFTVIAMCLT
jgi:hypothetical protein